MTDYSIWLIFALGIIVGGVLFSKDFRQKFFAGLRKFLVGIGKSNMGKTTSSTNIDHRHIEHVVPKTGYIPAPKPKPRIIDCPDCEGIGQVKGAMPALMIGAPGTKERWITCSTCEGSGKVYEKQ